MKDICVGEYVNTHGRDEPKTTLFGKPEWKIPHGRLGRKCQDNIKIFEELGYEGVNWTTFVSELGTIVGSRKHMSSNDPCGSINGG
jgi:hypothetical protein